MTSDPQPAASSNPPPRGRASQCIALAVCWTIVGVPAGWGVAQTVRKSIPLFTAPAAHRSATQPAGAGGAR